MRRPSKLFPYTHVHNTTANTAVIIAIAIMIKAPTAIDGGGFCLGGSGIKSSSVRADDRSR